MFLSENLNVETRTPRLALSAESGQLSGAMEYGWVEPQSVWQAVAGIHNYANTLFRSGGWTTLGCWPSGSFTTSGWNISFTQ